MEQPKDTTIQLTCPVCGRVFRMEGATARYKAQRQRTICCSIACRAAARQNTPDSFWRWVDRSGGPGACWPWIGRMRVNGYGRFSYEGRLWRSHRLAWQLTHGPIPDGLDVLHDCPNGDDPACCNPRHLWLGTDAENIRDRDAKERHRTPTGSAHSQAILAEWEVRLIRVRYVKGVRTLAEVAAEFGISVTTVWSIIHRRTWRDIP